jgi:tRNA dimethylallyltransferase
MPEVPKRGAAGLPVLILFGPTASGKTGLLLSLFGGSDKVCSAEVVSADSMQVYRGMDIGTAKPSAEERAQLPHHLIDIRNPGEQFNAGDFVRLADKACLDIAGRNKLPVLSGGTGFYLKNFILGLPEAPPSDPEIREGIKKELREKGAAALMEELASGDPESAARIHPNDEYRLVRALEVLRLTGRPLSSCRAFGAPARDSGAGARPLYRFLIIGLSRPREELYRRIDLRCEAMFRAGLAAEVRRLCDAGYTPRDPGLRAIGYREFFACAESGRLPEDTAALEALVARNSRRYAKRQITYFNSIPGVKWIDAARDPAEQIRFAAEGLIQDGFPGER